MLTFVSIVGGCRYKISHHKFFFFLQNGLQIKAGPWPLKTQNWHWKWYLSVDASRGWEIWSIANLVLWCWVSGITWQSSISDSLPPTTGSIFKDYWNRASNHPFERIDRFTQRNQTRPITLKNTSNQNPSAQRNACFSNDRSPRSWCAFVVAPSRSPFAYNRDWLHNSRTVRHFLCIYCVYRAPGTYLPYFSTFV